MKDAHAFLTRTARLLQLDFFDSLGEEEIVAGLTSRRVAIRVAPGAAESLAGQSTLATSALLVSQLGAQVSIEMEETPMLGAQPPFPSREGLQAALLEGSALLATPFAPGTEKRPDVEIVLGGVPRPGAAAVGLGVSVDDFSCEVGPAVAGPCVGTLPFGATLAAISVAAECTRASVGAIAARSGIDLGAQYHLGPPRGHRLALPELPHGGGLDLGRVDLISAGAITNGALAVLLRVPGLASELRVIDDDTVSIDNLNRCGLFTRPAVGEAKADALAAYGGQDLAIESVRARFDQETLAGLLPLAPRIAVGVDHIPARWFAQERWPAWLGVAGTSHLEVVASEHRPGMPCAGCLHAEDDDAPSPLPTISFVSAVAGCLLAHRLLSVAGGAAAAPPTWAWCLALHEQRGMAAIGLAADPRCPVGCPAARAAAEIRALGAD
jgi:ThiF family